MAKITNPYYEELAYIQSTGTQYIDTGITGYTAFKLKFQLLNTGSNQYGIFGSRQSGGSNRFGCMVYSGLFHFMIGNNNMWNASVDTNIHELDFNSTRLIADGVEYATPQGQSYGNISFFLFAMNLNSNGRIPQKIWYFETYDENGNLTHNFVPARREDSGVIGLSDTVTNTFYTNSGTGTFSYGLLADVTADPVNSGTITGTGEYAVGSNVTLTAIPNSGYTFEKWLDKDYVLLSAIESTGTQYINTEYVVKSNTKIELDVQYTETPSSAYINGIRQSTTGYFTFSLYSDQYYVGLNTEYPMGFKDLDKHTWFIDIPNLQYGYDENVFNASSFTFPTVTRGFTLFARNTGSVDYYAKEKISECRIYENGTLVHKYIPVLKSGVGFGLLDLVEMKFYGNSGTGEFLGYEESGATQYPSVTDNPWTVKNISNSLILTAQFKKTANCRYKVNGAWKNAMMYIKQNGTWKTGTPKIKVNGNWKEGG